MKIFICSAMFFIAGLFILNSQVQAELGSGNNTLFLWHFDGSISQADYAKAVGGPMNAIQGDRNFAVDFVKFGASSYHHSNSGGSRFSIYTNGQWTIDPHEGTIDYWLYMASADTGLWNGAVPDAYGIGNGFYAASSATTPTRRLWIATARSIYASTDGFMVRFSSATSFANDSPRRYQLNIPYTTMTANAPLDQWNHVAWTWSSLANRSYVFLNGVAVASTFSYISTTAYGVSDAEWQAVGSWYVQGFEGNLAGYGLPTGRSDELRISNIDRYGGVNFTRPSSPYGLPASVREWQLYK